LISLFFSNVSFAAENTIRFGIPAEEYPPYIMNKEGGFYGIVTDAYLEIAKSMGVETKLSIAPIKRLRVQAKMGELDAFPAAPEWESKSISQMFTDGIIKVSDNLIRRTNNKIPLNRPEDLSGLNLVLMEGYIYPSLETMIKNKFFHSVRAKHFASLLKMIEHARVDAGVLDKNVAQWIIRKNNLTFKNEIHFVEPGFDEVAYRIIFFSRQDRWKTFIKRFNAELKRFKKSQRWQQILNRYR